MVALVDRAFAMAALTKFVTARETGAVVTFVGHVRERSDDGRAVRGLHYEAHAEMAIAALRAVADDARARFAVSRVAIVHRIGDLAIGDIAVGIAVGAAHRGAAFDACEFAIDELKRRVPIWKQERYVDGDAVWRENP